MIPPSKRWWWESAQTVRRTLERSEYVLHDSARAARNPECTPRVRLQGPVDAAPPGASLLPGTLTLYAFPGCAYPLLRIFDRDLLSLRGLHGRVPLHRLDVLTETGSENKAHDLAACASIGGVNCACAVLGWEMPL